MRLFLGISCFGCRREICCFPGGQHPISGELFRLLWERGVSSCFLWSSFFLLPLGALAAVFGYAVAAPGSQWLGRTLVRGSRAARKIALTFDDGPSEATPLVLDVLSRAGIRATFFLCGQNVERFPEHARRIAEEGHEIGNHTYSHPYFLWKTPGRIAWEIDRAQNVIASQTGQRPRLFRPPYGFRWFGLFPILHRRDLTAVMWSVFWTGLASASRPHHRPCPPQSKFPVQSFCSMTAALPASPPTASKPWRRSEKSCASSMGSIVS